MFLEVLSNPARRYAQLIKLIPGFDQHPLPLRNSHRNLFNDNSRGANCFHKPSLRRSKPIETCQRNLRWQRDHAATPQNSPQRLLKLGSGKQIFGAAAPPELLRPALKRARVCTTGDVA